MASLTLSTHKDNRCCALQMFSKLEKSDLIQWSVSVSYVEIYNETFRDLCDPSTSPSDITIYEQQCVPNMSMASLVMHMQYSHKWNIIITALSVQ